jgi:hypothetical protein
MKGFTAVESLCQQGMRLERQGKLAEAKHAYAHAWSIRTSDYDACVAAHFMARVQSSPEETLRWNREALQRADAAASPRVATFYPSLYCCMGLSHEKLGDLAEAQHYLGLAAQHVHTLIQNEYGRTLKHTIRQAMERVRVAMPGRPMEVAR